MNNYWSNTIFSLIVLFSFVGCSHAKDKSALKEIKASEIIRTINKGKDVSIVNAIIYDDLDFTSVEDKAVSATNEVTVQIPRQIYFQDCVFMGRVSTYERMTRRKSRFPIYKKVHFGGEVCFYNCDFRKTLNFNEATVDGNLNFTQTQFNDTTTFNHILVNGTQSQFVKINANKEFSFVYSTVRGNLNFMDAQFQHKLSFSGLTAQNLILNNTQIEKSLDLSNMTLLGILQFNYSQCKGEAFLSYSKFFDRVSINETSFESDLSFEASYFYGKVKMNKSSFANKINTQGAIFIEVPEMNEIKRNNEEPILIETRPASTIQIN